MICKNLVKDEVENLNLKLSKINENITKDISEQKNKFEALKRQRLLNQSSGTKSKKLIKINIFNYIFIIIFVIYINWIYFIFRISVDRKCCIIIRMF